MWLAKWVLACIWGLFFLDETAPCVFQFSLTQYDLAIVCAKQDGIQTLAQAVRASPRKVVAATNGGIFLPDLTPEGLLIRNGQVLKRLNTQKGKGNFYLEPNGVFWIMTGRAQISSTAEYMALEVEPEIAIQSGPLLVAHQRIHARLDPTSLSRFSRNVLGLDAEQNLYLVYFAAPCTLYFAAAYMRDQLNCVSALYLGGVISGYYSATHQYQMQQPFASIILLHEK